MSPGHGYEAQGASHLFILGRSAKGPNRNVRGTLRQMIKQLLR
jgi:hypothetical protein